MLDLLRFLAATFTTLITIHWAYNIAWLVAAPILAILALPFKRVQGFPFLAFVGHLFQYYVMIGCLAIIRRNWEVDYPHLTLWKGVLSAIVVVTWMFGLYFKKLGQEQMAYDGYKDVSYRSDNESLNKGQDWIALREMVPWYMVAALAGTILAVISIFSLGLFINPLTQTISSWYGYVLEVPLLPILLAIAGFLMAIQFVVKAVAIFGDGAFSLASNLPEFSTVAAYILMFLGVSAAAWGNSFLIRWPWPNLSWWLLVPISYLLVALEFLVGTTFFAIRAIKKDPQVVPIDVTEAGAEKQSDD